MNKQISEAQAISFALCGQVLYWEWERQKGTFVRTEQVALPVFINKGESQAEAISRFMRRVSTKNNAKQKRNFPKYVGGMSTADYVSKFLNMNNLRRDGTAEHLTHPSPVPEGLELIVSEDPDYFMDLV